MIFHKKSESHWESISDLMTGLMMIFIFICLGFLLQRNHEKQNYTMVKDQIYADLKREFKPEEIARWGTNIDPETLAVTFIEPMVFFGNDDAEVNAHFRQVLDEFFPRYVEVLQPYSDKIVEVRIEGNCSLAWSGDVQSKEAYFYNMKLSQDRAFNVLQYIYGIEALRDRRPWLVEKLRANGASYSKAQKDNDAASRSVEISIKRDAEKELITKAENPDELKSILRAAPEGR